MTSNPWAAARAAAQSSRPQTAPSTFVTFPPTAEQSEILAAFRRGEDMVITAGDRQGATRRPAGADPERSCSHFRAAGR
jgi:hypothetical protein